MKKTITAIAAALLLVAFGGTTAFAGHHYGHMNLLSCHLGVSHSCVDTDGDGICDHYAECFTDLDGDGVCDYHEANRNAFCDASGDGICDHYAGQFTDTDGDGVCDYLGAAASHHTSHHGLGHGAGRCRG